MFVSYVVFRRSYIVIYNLEIFSWKFNFNLIDNSHKTHLDKLDLLIKTPWYVVNRTLRTYFHYPTIAQYNSILYQRFHINLLAHNSILIKNTVTDDMPLNLRSKPKRR